MAEARERAWTAAGAVIDGRSGMIGDRDPRFDRPPASPVRERRAHARAYGYWRQLRAGRRLPDIADVKPVALASFAANSVLFELGTGARAAIRFIGASLAAEAGADPERPGAVMAAPGTVLGELADRLPLIGATGAPLDFEAEFLGLGGVPTLYRGVLLPFAEDQGRVAYVYGVITWKMVETAVIGEDVRLAVGSAFALTPAAPVASPWDCPLPAAAAASLDGDAARRLGAARTWAALAGTDHAHRDASLHAALSATYDLLLSEERRPDAAAIAAVVAKVFGAEDATASARHRAVLARACALRLGRCALAGLLDRLDHGVAGFLAIDDAAPPGWPDRPTLALAAIDEDALAVSPRDRSSGDGPEPLVAAAG